MTTATTTRTSEKLYSLLALKGHLYKTDTSLERSSGVGLCLPLLLLVDSVFFNAKKETSRTRVR